jgi:hypothetical protein
VGLDLQEPHMKTLDLDIVWGPDWDEEDADAGLVEWDW